MRRQAVRAETEATVETVNILLVLLSFFVNYASVVELLV